jgi:hypothetical protein
MFAELSSTRVGRVKRVKPTEGSTMFKRKLTMLVGLALAVAVLSPASASAKAGGTHRPMKGKISATVSLNVLTGALTADGEGVATHLGKFTTSLKGTVTITPTGVFGNGTQTVVAANGDELTGTYTLSTPGAPAVAHTTTIVTTVTGGTGRFSDASGTLTSVSELSPISFSGGVLVNSAKGTITAGRIRY